MESGFGPFAAEDGAAAVIFASVLSLHLILALLQGIMKRESATSQETALAKEIKALLKQADAFSTPATFAKSAKLRRAAVQKEKELAEVRLKTKQLSHRQRYVVSFLPTLLQTCVNLFFLWWFWRTPVATIPSRLVHPFGRMFSFTHVTTSSDVIPVSVIPWLMLCNSVSSFISRKIPSSTRR